MMRKFKNAAETLDALEEEIAFETKLAESIALSFHPTLLIVALYRLAETQISFALEAGPVDWEQQDRFERHEKLGAWITEQPE